MTKTTIRASNAREAVEQMANLADIQINGSRPWDIQIHNPIVFDKVVKDGSLGLGETYMAGWWDCEELDEFFFRVNRCMLDRKIKFNFSMLWMLLKNRMFNLQNKAGSMEVIDKHYQLGTDLFERMLDPTMTYSCGYWKEAKTLQKAQVAKYDLICRKLYLNKGMHILDIGCGWGGFAKYAAENYGVEVTGITLSTNQAEYAKNRCKGLPVTILVQDYRDVQGTFDSVLEIGMFEHVGYKNFREFMSVVHRVLHNDGLFMLHTIGKNSTTAYADPWLNKYIFPNGELPSIEQLGKAIDDLFVMEDWHNFGADYDKTLMSWFRNFHKHWDEIKDNYSETFYRMWKYYLHLCAGAFRARRPQLWQVVLSKEGCLDGYTSIR